MDRQIEKGHKRIIEQDDFGDKARSRVQDATYSIAYPSVKNYTYDKKNQELSVKQKGKQEKKIPANVANEKDLKNASLRVTIDELLNKAKSYPKVEGYLRDLDKKRIDEGKDVPVTKRETAVRTADENAAKRLESQGKSVDPDLEKCNSHVLTEGKAEKKQPEKKNGHVFGNTPLQKENKEMVKVPAEDAWKSNLVKSVDSLLEKAIIGYHARGGKFETGTHKNPKNHGKVSSPTLSEERKKEILSGVKTKATSQADKLGLHKRASEERSSKSLDERTADLVKALDVDYGRRKSGSRHGGSRNDPDAGIDRKKKERMEVDAEIDRLAKRSPIPPSVVESWGKKSLDERTCDLTKALTQDREREIHSAVTAARMIKEDVPGAEKLDYKPEDLARVARTHNNIAAARTQKSICDKWMKDSPYITKGSNIGPLQPGTNLLKDEEKDEDSGAE